MRGPVTENVCDNDFLTLMCGYVAHVAVNFAVESRVVLSLNL